MKLENYKWNPVEKKPDKRCNYEDCFSCPYPDCIATYRQIMECENSEESINESIEPV